MGTAYFRKSHQRVRSSMTLRRLKFADCGCVELGISHGDEHPETPGVRVGEHSNSQTSDWSCEQLGYTY